MKDLNCLVSKLVGQFINNSLKHGYINIQESLNYNPYKEQIIQIYSKIHEFCIYKLVFITKIFDSVDLNIASF